ncbi:MAG TPA: hypothetical protein VEC37_17680 [Bacillota bacterium]|nr:hypothetical protein [Bacillota bacterium]
MRKRLLVPVLTLAFLLMVGSCTLAVNTVSMNFLLNGESEIDNTDYDLSQLTFGLTVPLDKKISIGAEIATGEIDNGGEADTSSYRIKGAYKLFADRNASLDLTGGIYHRGIEIPGYADYEISSLTIGVDGRLIIDSKAWFDVGLALGLLPDEELDEYGYYGRYYKGDPDSLVLFNLKFNYLINKQLGLTVGYSSETYDSELLPRDNSHTGFNVGAFLRF